MRRNMVPLYISLKHCEWGVSSISKWKTHVGIILRFILAAKFSSPQLRTGPTHIPLHHCSPPCCCGQHEPLQSQCGLSCFPNKLQDHQQHIHMGTRQTNALQVAPCTSLETTSCTRDCALSSGHVKTATKSNHIQSYVRSFPIIKAKSDLSRLRHLHRWDKMHCDHQASHCRWQW